MLVLFLENCSGKYTINLYAVKALSEQKRFSRLYTCFWLPHLGFPLSVMGRAKDHSWTSKLFPPSSLGSHAGAPSGCHTWLCDFATMIFCSEGPSPDMSTQSCIYISCGNILDGPWHRPCMLTKSSVPSVPSTSLSLFACHLVALPGLSEPCQAA